MADNSQKFLGRNRAPRVQIEYDVELYGAEKKVQLPFVMGVMSDLLGKSTAPQPAVADRKFLEIDVDNFDNRMKAMAPRASFNVPNTLSGEGNLAIDLTFESMKDFSPGAIASKVDALRPLLDARTQLQTLMAYMDGKSGAEELIEKILQNPGFMSSLVTGETESNPEQESILDSLRAAEQPQAKVDESENVLAALAAEAPRDEDMEDRVEDTLAALASSAPILPTAEVSETEDALAALAATVSITAAKSDTKDETLSALRDLAPDADNELDEATDVLRDLARAEENPAGPETPSNAAILSELSDTDVPPASDPDQQLADTLQTLASPPLEEEEPASDDAIDAVLDDLTAAPVAGDNGEDPDLTELLGSLSEIPSRDEGTSQIEDVLAAIPETQNSSAQDDELAAILDGLDLAEETDVSEGTADLQDLLEDITSPENEVGDEAAELDDVLAGLDLSEQIALPESQDDLGDVLSDLTKGSSDEGEAETSTAETLEGLLADLDVAEGSTEEATDLDSILSGLEPALTVDETEVNLEDLLGGSEVAEADLDDLLGLDDEEENGAGEDLDLDDLLADLDSADVVETKQVGDIVGLDPADDLSDLDDLLGELGADGDALPGASTLQVDPVVEPEFAYGTISVDRPVGQQLTRRRFRIALFGDFSGRAARGQIETGDALASRPAILLDADTVEDVIEGFASELVLPIGENSGGIAVKLRAFDDLHPDELFENVALFSELVSLRKQLQSGVTVEHATRSLSAWAETFGTPLRVPKRSSASNAVPADRRLSAFQQLIGDQGNSLCEASPIEELLARVVGPHIRALPNPEVAAMQEAVDAALSDAMRLVLHHPEFQSLEAQWRSLDLIARSVEVDDNLEVVLYDVSAEELAADLAKQDDLSGCGFTRLLSEEPMDPEVGRGGYSALIGMYGFEETPPHAELLGRIARVAAHVDAPFFTSLSPEFLKTALTDRSPLVANAWDTLKQMPEAGHLALASPRFLLRRPYGSKSDPVDAFDFEEFSEAEGLKGMLWGNPVVLVTILLARSFKQNGASLQLGSIMTLGDMPFHTVIDRFGDQIALPCTERNIDLDKIAMANERGVMAISAVKGRDELRLTSFSSLAGAEVLGPWSGVPAPAPSPADPREKTGVPVPQPNVTSSEVVSDEVNLDDLGLDDLDLDLDDLTGGSIESVEDELGDLDALLAGFGDEAQAGSDDGEMDAELAALLADL